MARSPKESPVRYPLGTIVSYGPDDRTVTKFAVSILLREGESPVEVKRWSGVGVGERPEIADRMFAWLREKGVRTVAIQPAVLGCPHEEGEDYPRGEDCPFCPFWKGKKESRWAAADRLLIVDLKDPRPELNLFAAAPPDAAAPDADGWLPLWPAGAPQPDGVAPKEEPALKPFLRDETEPRGAVLVCPGGGYGGRADHEADPVAEAYRQAGLHAFVLRYRVAPHRHPAPLQDAQRALRLIRHRAAEWRIRPDRIAILGFSAGGHLAATAATLFGAGAAPAGDDAVDRESARPDAALLCYPVATFGEHTHRGSMENLLGAAAPDELRRLLSPDLQVTDRTPPCFLWHTSDDDAVPVENSLLFAAALRRRGVRFALHVFPAGPHGVGLASDRPELAGWHGLSVRWFADMGWC